MAAALAMHINPGVHAESAGVDAYGSSAHVSAITVIKRAINIDLSGHRPRHVREFDLRSFDKIIALDQYVAKKLRQCYDLDDQHMIVWEVIDPWESGLAAYEQTANEIRQLLATM